VRFLQAGLGSLPVSKRYRPVAALELPMYVKFKRPRTVGKIGESGPCYHVLRRGNRSKQRHKRAPATTNQTTLKAGGFVADGKAVQSVRVRRQASILDRSADFLRTATEKTESEVLRPCCLVGMEVGNQKCQLVLKPTVRGLKVVAYALGGPLYLRRIVGRLSSALLTKNATS
jgi:hypothetical protein